MELLDRYVHMVRLFLPGHQRDDIADELREELEAAVGDQEEARGRALTRDEQLELLRTHGHPLLVAAIDSIGYARVPCLAAVAR